MVVITVTHKHFLISWDLLKKTVSLQVNVCLFLLPKMRSDLKKKALFCFLPHRWTLYEEKSVCGVKGFVAHVWYVSW